jgi:hypothetical protein
VGDSMSFNDDVLKSIDDFKNSLNDFQISMTDYNQTFEKYKDSYRDIEILKEKMKDTVAKAIFISEVMSYEGDENNE